MSLERVMIQSPARLAVQPADMPLPVRFAAPLGTIVFVLGKSLLSIYVQPACAALDWDVASGLMARIARPRPGTRTPSMLCTVSEWTVELAECAAAYLL